MLSLRHILGFLVVFQLIVLSVVAQGGRPGGGNNGGQGDRPGSGDNGGQGGDVGNFQDPGLGRRPDDSNRGRRPDSDEGRRRWPGGNFWRNRCPGNRSYCDINSWRGYYQCSFGRYRYNVCPRGTYCAYGRGDQIYCRRN